MAMLALFAALVIAVGAPVVHVVDERGAPVGGARIAIVHAFGADILEVTDRSGNAPLADASDARELDVSALGFVTRTIALDAAHAVPSVVQLQLAEIGRVSVATGSARQAHRLPVPVSTLDGATLAGATAPTIDEALRALPGFDRTRSNSAFTNYGQLRVSFSGAGNDRGIVLVDGIPAQDGFGGQIDWLAYPTLGITSAELLRGSGSALYGANGVGGVLELNGFAPNADAAAVPDGRLSVAIGSPHLGEDGLRVRFPLAPHLTAALVTETRMLAASAAAPGYQSALDTLARSTSSSTRARVRYAFGASSIDVGTLAANDAQAEGRPNYTFARTLAQNDVRFSTTAAHVRLDARAYTRHAEVVNVADAFPAMPGVLRSTQHVPTSENGAALDAFLTAGPNEVGLRVDTRSVHGVSDQVDATGALTALGSGTQQYRGIAVQDTYEGGRVGAIVGLRADRVRLVDGTLVASNATTTIVPRTDSVVSPRLALRYSITPQVAVRASVGSGFREPFLNELVRGFVIGATTYAPNPMLVPERSATRSIGFDTLGTRSHFSLDLTSTRVNDAIAFVTQSPTLQMRKNLGRTQTDSTTAAYTTALSGCARLRASATTQYARVTSGPARIVARRLAFVPDRSLDIGLDGGRAFAYGIDVALVGEAYADDRNLQPLGAALVAGVRFTMPLGDGTSLALRANNVGGARYLTSIDRQASGPEVALALSVPLGPRTRVSDAEDCARLAVR